MTTREYSLECQRLYIEVFETHDGDGVLEERLVAFKNRSLNVGLGNQSGTPVPHRKFGGWSRCEFGAERDLRRGMQTSHQGSVQQWIPL